MPDSVSAQRSQITGALLLTFRSADGSDIKVPTVLNCTQPVAHCKVAVAVKAIHDCCRHVTSHLCHSGTSVRSTRPQRAHPLL